MDNDDIVLDKDSEIVSENSLQVKNKQLREKIKSLEQEKKEYLDGWQRSKADLLNAKKQFEDHRNSLYQKAQADLIEELLPSLDSFSMAFSNKDAWEKVDSVWRKGVEYIYQQLLKPLTEGGLILIHPAVGDKEDAILHESIDTEDTDDIKLDGTIASVVQVGYMYHTTVLRPAKVRIYHFEKTQ